MTDAWDVAVAGAGVSGLSCAAALADLGLRVAVIERDTRLGGRAASWADTTTGLEVDIGPHVLTSEHRNFLALLSRCGTHDGILWQPDPLATLLDAGRVFRMHAPSLPPPLHGLANLRNALRAVSLRDLASNIRVVWRAARLDEVATLALDGESAFDYLTRLGVTGDFINWFWRSVTLALLNMPLEKCSAASMMRVFRLMLGRSGYHFGFPRIALARLFVPGSVNRIRAAGGVVLTGATVVEVESCENRFQSFRLQDGRHIRARAGVLALPPPGLAPGPFDQRCWAHCEKSVFEPSRYITTMLWFDRKVTSERFWARVWNPADLNTDFYDLSNIRLDAGPARSVIASNAIHAGQAWGWNDVGIITTTMEELAEFAPATRAARLLHARVHRIPMAVPGPLPGSERRRPPALTRIEGLCLAGDWTATGLPCSMESAARSGALAAEAVAYTVFGRRISVAIPPPETVAPVSLLRRRPSGAAY
jgi:uncharacterized protein with NAD-binding domain and iron-sulfur cluster